MFHPFSLPVFSEGEYDTCVVIGTTAKQPTHAARFTTHPQFDSNFTLERGSEDNMLSMRVEFPSLSDSTLHNIKDNLSNRD